MLKKSLSGTSVFLWILWNFYEHLFLRSTSGGCFCRFSILFSKRQQGFTSTQRFYLTYCPWRKFLQSKTILSSLFRFKDIVLKGISLHLVYKFMCSFWAPRSNWKANKKSKNVSHYWLLLPKGHDASFEDLTILLKENSKIKLHL